MTSKYMMATKAYHKLGDISRDEPDVIVVNEEHDDHYIGRWLEGLGFTNVKFPKDTTRELTPEERDRYRDSFYAIGNTILGKLDMDSTE